MKSDLPIATTAVPVVPTVLPLLPDQRIGEYEIDRVLGQGLHSAVYGAVHRQTGRSVAIRECLPGRLVRRERSGEVTPIDGGESGSFERALAHFVADSELLIGLDHPNIVSGIEVVSDRGTAYLVTELVHGQTLAEALRLMRLAGESQLRELFEALGGALDVIHVAGAVHGGVQPLHVLLTADDVPVLLDFTASRRMGDAAANRGGDLADGYAAPEQYGQGPWSSATDLYGLGAILYRAVAGEPPTSAPERERMKTERTRMRSALEAGSGLFSRRFLRAIDSALVLDPERRLQRVADLRHRVEHGSVGLDPEPLEPRASDLESGVTMDLQPVVPAPAGSEVDEVFIEAFRGRLKSRSRPDLERRIGERGPSGPDWRRKPVIATIGAVIVLAALLMSRESSGPPQTPAGFDGEAIRAGSAGHGSASQDSDTADTGQDDSGSAGQTSVDPDRAASIAPTVTDQSGVVPAPANDTATADARDGPTPLIATVSPGQARDATPAGAGTSESEAGTSAAGSSAADTDRADGGAAATATASPAPGDDDAPALSTQDRAEVERLLLLAEADIAANRLRSPAGNNAWERLRSARALAGADPRIDAGLDAVAEKYVELARSAASRGQGARARTFLERAESVRPELPAVLAARAEIGLR